MALVSLDSEHFHFLSFLSPIRLWIRFWISTRPDIAHAVGVVSRYMNNLGKEHWEIVKWILRYLRGTANHALCFGGLETVLQGYVDSDMTDDKDIRRSTTGYVFTIGGTIVSWISKLQKVVSLSTT
jgi:hypothetical protein